MQMVAQAGPFLATCLGSPICGGWGCGLGSPSEPVQHCCAARLRSVQGQAWRSACLGRPPLPHNPLHREPRIGFYLGPGPSPSWRVTGWEARRPAGAGQAHCPCLRPQASCKDSDTASQRQLSLSLSPLSPNHRTPAITMPGVPGPGSEMAVALEERLGLALEELRAVAEAGRAAVTQAAEAAASAMEPVARAAEDLRVETAALSRRLDALGRQVEVLSLRLGVPLAPDLEPELEPSELLLAAADPEALFQAAEDAGTPVAHPPAFSTCRRSSAGLARSSSLVSPSGLGKRGRGGGGWC